MPSNLAYEKYIESALSHAADYITLYRDSDKLKGKDDAETKAIHAFLDSDAYQQEHVRAFLRGQLEAAIKDKKPIDDNEQRKVIYLAGPYGAKPILMDAVRDPLNVQPEIMALRHDLASAVVNDFAALKEAVSTQLEDGKEWAYAKWRPLLFGLDNAIAELARDKRLHFVMDNSLAYTPQKGQENVVKDFKEQKAEGCKLEVLAVALTPEEAEEKAKKIKNPPRPGEAAQSALQFSDRFNEVCRHVPNVTLFDEHLNVLYSKKKGHENRSIRSRSGLDFHGAGNAGLGTY